MTNTTQNLIARYYNLLDKARAEGLNDREIAEFIKLRRDLDLL